MKVFGGLVCLAKQGKSVQVLMSVANQLPTWLLTDTSTDSLNLVKEGFNNITGTRSWPFHFVQSGTFEYVVDGEKHIYIIYHVYLPAICEFASNVYKWVALEDLDTEHNMMSIIRYIVSKRI